MSNKFPKKYTPQDLNKRAKLHRETQNILYSNNKDNVFSVSQIPISSKLSYSDIFLMYVRDFFICNNNLKTKQDRWNYLNPAEYQNNLFLFQNNQFDNICSNYLFFKKRNQTLQQAGIHKLERRIYSLEKKHVNHNMKLLDNYFSSFHKLFMSDSDFYVYLISKFQELRESGKIENQINIWYRSFDLQTSVPEDEITWKEEKVPFYTLKYFVWAKCEALPVCIQTIDLCCGDVALLVHPKDKRYNKYIWKMAIIPLSNRQIPIIWDESVNIAENYGVKRVCPCENQESIAIAKKYWLPTDILVFTKQGLYTDYIHESAFVWQDRKKYYQNIEWFIRDIGNLAKKEEIVAKIPYIDSIDEPLTVFPINQTIINVQEEKSKIIQDVIDRKIHFSFIDQDFGYLFDKLDSLRKWNKEIWNNNSDNYNISNNSQEIEETKEWISIDTKSELEVVSQQIREGLSRFFPNHIICNSQLPIGWKIPLIKDEKWNLSFFDIQKEVNQWKWSALQICFDFIVLCLYNIWAIWYKEFWTIQNDNSLQKLCEYEKLFVILSEHEKAIQYFVNFLQSFTKEKKEYTKFIEMVQNLIDDNNSSLDEFSELIKNSKVLGQNWNWLLLKIKWLSNEIFYPNFLQLCIPCYIKEKNISISQIKISDMKKRVDCFYDVLIQQLFLWDLIYSNFEEFSYEENSGFTPSSQQNFLWENPIRLMFLVNKTYNSQDVLLNNIFLKQIWNAVRLCIQKDFLPESIESILQSPPTDFEDFDLSILSKLNDLYDEWNNINSFETYINFFQLFKASSQDLFFSWYLEIQKERQTENVKFICSYFFNFLLNILYPLIPEYVDALSHISWRDFLQPIQKIQLNKTSSYDMNILYELFVKIKHAKLELDIKQHETFSLFVKSTPSILENLEKYEQIFKNYFHISKILYLRLHEQNPVWYEIVSDDILLIWIKSEKSERKQLDSVEFLEKELKDLSDKLDLLKQRLLQLPEWELREETETEYAKTKSQIDDISIKVQILSQ